MVVTLNLSPEAFRCQDCVAFAKQYTGAWSLYRTILAGLGIITCLVLFIKKPQERPFYAVLGTILILLMLSQ